MEKVKTASNEAMHTRDVNSKEIFGNVVLTSQFLRDYSGLSIFADVMPEDIEDVTERYRGFLGVEFGNDTVKKVRIRQKEKEQEVYVIPLIEHKSKVDYDVSMQLLRYMVVIWYDYAKRQNQVRPDSSRTKGFRYPLIIPIVYYEGSMKWTADMHLRNRIENAEQLPEYVPDFTYKVVGLRDYTNEELQKRHDEMALVMLFNKVQSANDYGRLFTISREFVNSVYEEMTEDVRNVFLDVIWALFMKMNVSVEEAGQMIETLEADGMGYLFENMEKMDIQAERENTRKAREAAELAKREAAEAAKEVEAVRREAAEVAKEVAEKVEKAKREARMEARQEAEEEIKSLKEELEALRKILKEEQKA